MKSESEMISLKTQSYKSVEKILGIKISNGQSMKAIRKTIDWVIEK